jgi:hypothetical protein
MKNNRYNDQVFINCPFDGQYLNMFRACVFTVLDAGFVPRCSREVDNAMRFRLESIVRIIKECRYGIHDLSRVGLDTTSRLPRFNMPFELGVFYGAEHFGIAHQKKKECLVLERYRHRYHKFISDIAGVDVTEHRNVQRTLILAVRNWLVTASHRTSVPLGEKICDRFKMFQADIKRACRHRSTDYDSMPFVELVWNMTEWLRLHEVDCVPLFEV